jgi:hypothetical protein
VDTQVNFEYEVNKRLTDSRIRDLQKSGLCLERIYLDGYRDSARGWEIPIREPFSGQELFTRVRLDSPVGDEPRYIQPAGVGLLPFYPYHDNWAGISTDVSQHLIFSEGEKKVSKLMQEGFLAISMPGVSAYGSPAFIDSVSRFNWANRKVFLCFDSDIRIKKQVRSALIEFSKILYRKGALVREIELPDVSVISHKGGLDE